MNRETKILARFMMQDFFRQVHKFDVWKIRLRIHTLFTLHAIVRRIDFAKVDWQQANAYGNQAIERYVNKHKEIARHG